MVGRLPLATGVVAALVSVSTAAVVPAAGWVEPPARPLPVNTGAVYAVGVGLGIGSVDLAASLGETRFWAAQDLYRAERQN